LGWKREWFWFGYLLSRPTNECTYLCWFALWFLSFYLSFFFSSPNLSGHRLDVYHTSTHGLLQIQDAKKSPKIAIWAPSHNFLDKVVRWCPDGDFWRLFCVLYLQQAPCSIFQTCILNSHYGHAMCRSMVDISSQLRHVSTIGKNLLSSNISSTCPHNMVNFGPLAVEIVSLVWGTPWKFHRVSRLGSVTARHSSIGRQPNFAALNRGRHLYSAGRQSRWALAHISSSLYEFLHLMNQ